MSKPRHGESFRSRRVSALEPGVNVYGYVFAEHGVGEVARGMVEVVRSAGLDYAVIPYTRTGSRQAVRFDDLGAVEARYDVNLLCINADALPELVDHFGPAILEGRYNIGMWAWEVDDMPASMASSARFLDEIWGCSRFTAAAIARAVMVPVFALAPPLVPRDPTDTAAIRRGDDFVFLVCFDYFSILERKNPLAAVAAFERAFPAGSGARLLVKTINGGVVRSEHARLLAAAARHPDVQVVDGYLSPAEQRALLGNCDAFVSLHRAEGFGFMLAEAMSFGKPVIATAFSGNLDFMTDRNSYLVGYDLVRVPAGCEPYPRTSLWAEPRVDEAAAAMRRVFDHREESARKGELARHDIAVLHSPAARTGFVRERFAAIRRGGKAGRAPGPKVAPRPFVVVGHDPRQVTRGLPVATPGLEADYPRAVASLEALMAGEWDELVPSEILEELRCGSLDGARREADGFAVVWGWAYDPRSKEPAPRIVLFADGQAVPLRIPTGSARLDVAAAFGVQLTTSGWVAVVPTEKLPAAGHCTFEALAVFDDGRGGRLAGAVPLAL